MQAIVQKMKSNKSDTNQRQIFTSY